MIKTSEIHIRDPFVVPIAEEGRYYLYGTTDLDCWQGKATGFDTYRSANLESWEGPFPAFRPAPGFWADQNYWAPEVHRYRGRFFMFASFKADGLCRGTQVLVADSPLGPFRPHSAGPLTPRDWECLDGTLFLDEAGAPWMVFCHEWVQVHDGEMCAMRLAADLSQVISEPLLLFRASEAPWGVKPEKIGYVTDGPFLYRARNGALLMLWASFGAGGYAQSVARSTSGHISGPWVQEPEPLYAQDGSHGMLFRAFDGRLMLSLHKPNKTPDERPLFLPLREEEGHFSLIGEEGD